MSGQNCNPFTAARNLWRTNEHRVEIIAKSINSNIGFEAVNLTAIGIALHINVNSPKTLLVRTTIKHRMRIA